MYHFFVDRSQMSEGSVVITGPDVNHIKNVLRMKAGERILVSDGRGKDCICEIAQLSAESVRAAVLSVQAESAELSADIWLFQGLPKGEKMEYIVQKAVELGVRAIVPVAAKRSIVKLDEKKAEAKRKRWNAISESAAKQSGRAVIPEVAPVMKFAEAVKFVRDFDVRLIPYEEAENLDCAGGMERTRALIGSIRPGQRAAVFIGPEGGFSEEEIALARLSDVCPVTLGRRILRTETAGLFVLSACGFLLEE